MAHKRKKEVVEEEYEFVPPEFDERKFLENDIRGTKILLLTAAFAIVFGIIAYILGGFNIYLGLIVMIAGMVALRYLYPLAKIPWSTVEKKTFFGNVGLFFFIFLAVWIILLNVPFSDHANPEIRDVSIWIRDASGNMTEIHPKGSIFSITQQGATGIVNITARVSDNSGLASVMVNVSGITGNFVDMTDIGSHTFSLSNTYHTGDYNFVIKAEDKVGHTSRSSTYILNIAQA
ncbi:MAG: hypothetical protein LUO84_00560 [Methanomassiliicoccales archaeon]|nr:hypothetical protein [Methanomassiliicoccales archaeon]